MRLKQARKENKYTQAQVADYLGIPLRTYQNYEREVNDPDSAILCRLADYYGVTLDYLMGLSDVPDPSKVNTVILPREEKQLIDSFQRLNADGQAEAMNYIAYLLSQDRFQKKEMPSDSDRLQEIA